MDAVKAMPARPAGDVEALVRLAAADMARVDALIMARMDSPDPTALIGLPLMALTEMLLNEGVDVLTWRQA